jgi:hypothetical protein
MPSYDLAYASHVTVDALDVKAQLAYERARQRIHKGSDIRKKFSASNSPKRNINASSWKSGNVKQRQALGETRLKKRELPVMKWEIDADYLSEAEAKEARLGKENQLNDGHHAVNVSLTDLVRPQVKRRSPKS